MNRLLVGLIVFLFISFLLWGVKDQLNQKPASPELAQNIALSPTTFVNSHAVLGVQTRTSNCQAVHGMPDAACTPGAVFATVTKEQICVPGYSTSVRNVPIAVKNAAYKEYSIASHKTGEYEVDHLISLELGGSNDIANLWPEAAEPRPGYHEKDTVENYLHQQVCSGKMNLSDAQSVIAHDWYSVYKTIGQ